MQNALQIIILGTEIGGGAETKESSLPKAV